MAESIDRQPFNTAPSLWHVETRLDTDQAPAPPPLITKKWLCVRFDLVQPSGRIYYERLYDYILTPEIIDCLGCTIDEIRNKSMKTFTRAQTLVLIDKLGL
jgi:hypothetical protein